MILPDTNLLIYATNAALPQHAAAKEWWDECLNGTEGIGLAWQVVLPYIRVLSSARAQRHPVPVGQLLDDVDLWLTSPVVTIIEPRATHVQALRSVLDPTTYAGDLVNDAHLAALAIEYGAVVHTADRDFARFRGVRWVNPLLA